ncbi:MAG: hypothetical protein OIF32_09985 [Campylobacterales bacterium]|nr:hypothetical protein [Campylobacterales bacterium]
MFQRRSALKFFAISPFLNFTNLFGQSHVEFAGDVFINGRELTHGTKIKKGDEIETLKNGKVRFKIGKDAFLLRENTKFKIENTQSKIFTVLTGGVLAVFGKGQATLKSRTMSAGIRGTGLYVEVESPDTTYVCTCYGEIVYDFDGGKEIVKTGHHERPLRFIREEKQVKAIKAPMLNHTDEELIQLEEMVERVPPFINNFDLIIRSIKKFLGLEIKSEMY